MRVLNAAHLVDCSAPQSKKTASRRGSARLAERRVFGALITPLRLEQLAEVIASDRPAPGEGIRCVFTMNLYHVVVLEHDAAFRQAYADAWAVTLDGAPVAAFANCKGVRRGRITGSDLMPVIVDKLRPGEHRPFFVVSDLATEGSIRRRLEQQGFGFADVAFAEPPFGFENDGLASQSLVDAIRRHQTTHIFMSVGAPKSEIWLHQHSAVLGDAYGLCFGSGANYMAGTRRRAPLVMRRLGLEWLHRLASEPRRLWRRYLLASWGYLIAMARDWNRP